MSVSNKKLNVISRICSLIKKELYSYFISPLAYIFMVVFLLLSGLFTFGASPFGDFINSNIASLSYSFFYFIPWLFLVLIPPITMRLWSEEFKSGTIELLFTFPINIYESVIAKFLSAFFLLLIAIICTLPLVFTVNYLGNPDNQIIVLSYLGSILIGAGYISIGILISSCCRNQVISYIYTIILFFIIVLVGHQAITNMFIKYSPVWLVDTIMYFSVVSHYNTFTKGVLDLSDVVYFITLIIFGLISTCMVLRAKTRFYT